MFSWEASWRSRGDPLPDSTTGCVTWIYTNFHPIGEANVIHRGGCPGVVGPDLSALPGAVQNGKAYMMGKVPYKPRTKTV